MKVAIAHLSDIHLVSDANKNAVLRRAAAIAACIAQIDLDVSTCFLVVSGDIAQSGLEGEYTVAATLFKEIATELRSRRQSLRLEWLAVPGNHDCNFLNDNKARQTLVEHLSPDDIDNAVVKDCVALQDQYEKFAVTLSPSASPLDPTGPLVTRLLFDVDGRSVLFNLLNSAWMSRLPEKQGALKFPLSLISADTHVSSAALVVSVLHHPFNWFESNNARTLKHSLEHISDVILTGHEHDSDSYHKATRAGDQLTYVEGGLLQGHKFPKHSIFNLLVFTLPDGEQTFTECVWSDSHGLYERSVTPTIPFQRNRHRLRREFVIRKVFSNWMNDPGAAFTHPRRQQLILRDLFVCPDIQEIDVRATKDAPPLLRRGGLLDYITTNGHVFIGGPEKSGKSTLTKILVDDCLQHSRVPLFINGAYLRSNSEEGVMRSLEDAFNRQYESPSFEQFRQMRDNRLLILDDYHKIPLEKDKRNKLVSLLSDLFPHFVVLAPTDTRLDEIMRPSPEGNPLLAFKHCDIVEFGHARRSDLIKQWYELDSDAVDVNELHRVGKSIQAIVGRDFVPSYPLFILIMLQQVEAHTKIDTTSGSFGYLYEVLINTSLAAARYAQVDLDTKLNYLAEFAYRLFSLETRSVSDVDMDSWHVSFCAIYRLSIDRFRLAEDLVSAGLLESRDGSWGFKYKYSYCFFVARYFRDHVTEQDMRARITGLSRRLYNEDAANIMIVLTHLSKDPFIIQETLTAARALFSSSPVCKLEDDVAFLNSGMIGSKDLVIDENQPVEANQQKLLEARDANERALVPIRQQLAEAEAAEKHLLDDALQANAAFKTVQILGQILKNYAGSIRGDTKQEIANECYALGLRTMSFFMDLVKEHHEDVSEGMRELLRSRREEMTDEERSHLANRFIFGLMEFFGFTLIRHVSDSVGAEKLAQTYKDVVDANRAMSYRLIDLSIKLDSHRAFPKAETFAIAKDVRRSVFGQAVFRRLVWFHFYVYERDYALRQSICDTVGITTEKRRLIDATRKKKKK